MKSQRWKDILDYSAREKRGVIILVGILLIVIVLKVLQPWNLNKDAVDFSSYESDIDRFESELAVEQKSTHRTYSQKKTDENNRYEFDFQAKKFNFNPNRVNRESMKSLGFSDALIDNITNYRKAGGRFFQAADLEKLYTMDASFFDSIEDYIQFEAKQVNQQMNETFVFNPNTISQDSLKLLGFTDYIAERWVKFRGAGAKFSSVNDVCQIYGIDTVLVSELSDYMVFPDFETSVEATDEIIELNTCEFKDLAGIKGISASCASKILSYRKLLGGYISHEQLHEVYDMTPEFYQILRKRTSINPDLVNKILINQADYSDFIRHPYLKTQDVKAILKFRDFEENIDELELLRKNRLISDSTFNKIHLYLSTE